MRGGGEYRLWKPLPKWQRTRRQPRWRWFDPRCRHDGGVFTSIRSSTGGGARCCRCVVPHFVFLFGYCR